MRFTWEIISACGFVCAMLPCWKKVWLNTWTCIMVQKKLPWHWFGVLLRYVGAGRDRDATWVKLLCNSGGSAGSSRGGWKGCSHIQGKQNWCGQHPCCGVTANLGWCAEVCLHVSQGPDLPLPAGLSHHHGALSPGPRGNAFTWPLSGLICHNFLFPQQPRSLSQSPCLSTTRWEKSRQ